MTFPRELFHIVQEVLSRVYPDKDFSRFNLYRNYSIYVDGKSIPSSRGYCLGMANNLVTLCQIVIYRLGRNNLPESIQTDYFCGNDDSILFVKGIEPTNEDFATIETNDDEILSGLSIIKHNTKSFWSLHPIIFEQYGKESFKSKTSRLAMSMAPCYLVDDIQTAKRLCNALSPLIGEVGRDAIPLVRRLSSFWGYDYYPEEATKDYFLGGWVSKYSKGCHTILRDIMDASEELIPYMYLAYRKCKAYESSILPHYEEEGAAENYSHLGAALGIRYLKSDIKLPKDLQRESLLLPRSEYERFYKKAFELSRRPDKPLKTAVKRALKVRGLEGIHKLEFLRLIQSTSDRPLAIPKQLVISSTLLWNEDDNVNIHPLYYSNMTSGYLEGLRREGSLLSPEIHINSRSEKGLIYEHTIPPNLLNVRRFRTGELDEIPKGSHQFSRNPEIPLSEYLEIYEHLPETITSFTKEFCSIPDKVYKYQPRDEREAIFILEIEDTDLLDILIECYREEQIESDEIIEYVPPPIEEMVQTSCSEHPANLLGGWDSSFAYFNVQFDNCTLCNLYSRFYRSRSMKETADDSDVRQSMTEEYHNVTQLIRDYVESNYPERLNEVLPLIEEVDVFGSEDGLFGSEGGLFDTGEGDY
jgi:hypothetical protein